MPPIDGFPVPVAGRKITPGSTSPGPPQHAVDDQPVIHPPAAPPRRPVRQQRLQPRPFLIDQIMTIKHDKVLPAHPPKIHETRPSRGRERGATGHRLRRGTPVGLPHLHDGARHRLATTLVNLQLASQGIHAPARESCSAWLSAVPGAGSRACSRSPRGFIAQSPEAPRLHAVGSAGAQTQHQSAIDLWPRAAYRHTRRGPGVKAETGLASYPAAALHVAHGRRFRREC